MEKIKKIEEKKELNEEELKKVDGGCCSEPRAYCPHCKKRISPSDWVCPYCGQRV